MPFSFYMSNQLWIASSSPLAHADLTISESLKLTSLTYKSHFRLFEVMIPFFSKVVLVITNRAQELCFHQSSQGDNNEKKWLSLLKGIRPSSDDHSVSRTSGELLARIPAPAPTVHCFWELILIVT